MTKYLFIINVFLLACLGFTEPGPEIIKKYFGEAGGKPIYEYTLKNSKGMQVKLISYGATITDIITPDRNGEPASVVFGFDSLCNYTSGQNPLAGAIVGRVANRIAGGRFRLEGKEYKLTANIHGGKMGFDKKVWEIEEIRKHNEVVLRMTYFSKDGEEGFPGNLSVSITYTLNSRNELKMEYLASTDRTTHVNLTNHTYFNLSGGLLPTITDTRLHILSDEYLEADRNNIPTGNIIPVKGTPLDFTRYQAIGSRINQAHPSLSIGNGYDLTYVLRGQSGRLRLAAEAIDSLSGRVLKAYTTEPGLVFYTGNYLNSNLVGRGQKPSVKYAAFCLETQHYPDAPNQPKFPGTVLKAGEVYRSRTVFRFSVSK